MKQFVIKYGIISGILSAGMMLATMLKLDSIGCDKAQVVGYICMLISYVPLYIGVMAYYKSNTQVPIKFGRAFAAGLLMMAICCAFYATTWQIAMPTLFPDFMDKFSAAMLTKLKQSGATAEAINKQLASMQQLKELYKNPILRWLLTFCEPMPVGLLVSLVAAFSVHRKRKALAS